MGEEVLVHGEAQGLIDRHHSPSLAMHASHRLNGLSTNERHATNVTYARFACNTTLDVRHNTVHHERMTERKSYRQMPDDLLTARQVVEQYPEAGLSQPMLRRWGRDGLIEVVRYPSGRMRFRRSNVEALLSPVGPSAPSVSSVPGVEGVELPGQGALL